MTKIIITKYTEVAKKDMGTDETFLKLKFHQEIINNDEKFG